MKLSDGRPDDERATDDFACLEAVIVRVTTWISTALLLLLIVLGLVSGDEKFIVRALNPVGPAVVGAGMLATGRPRAILQLAAGGVRFSRPSLAISKSVCSHRSRRTNGPRCLSPSEPV